MPVNPNVGTAGAVKNQQSAAAKATSDPTAILLAQGMQLYNQQVGATPGQGVSQAALRASLQQGYNKAEKNRKSVYAQINDAIMSRKAAIDAAYALAGQQVQGDASNRVASDQAGAQQRIQDAAQAAAAYGLEVAPPANQRADAQMAANQGQYESIANAWGGFLGASNQLADQSNTMTADAFKHLGVQQQAQLAAELQAALSHAQDSYRAGSPAHSLLSASQKITLLKNLGYTEQQARNAANSAALPPTQYTNSTGPNGSSSSVKYYGAP